MKKVQNIYDNKDFFDAYKEMRDTKINANELIEIPTIKEMLPDLKDTTILDLGCGDCSMARYFVEKSAKKVVAVDVSQNMLNEAKKHDCKNIELKLLSMEEINTIQGQFDIVYSSLAFHYVENFNKLMLDISNKLKENGYLIFSQEHPLNTSIQTLPKDGKKHLEIDGKRYYLLSDYNVVGIRKMDWNTNGVIKYHRNFETIINSIIGANMIIEEIRESKASKEVIEKMPKYEYQKDKPYFLFVKAKKCKQ